MRFVVPGLLAILSIPLVCAQGGQLVIDDPSGDQGAAPQANDIVRVVLVADGAVLHYAVETSAVPATRTFYQINLMPFGYQYYGGCRVGPDPFGGEGPVCDWWKRERHPESGQRVGPADGAKVGDLAIEETTDPPGFRVAIPYAFIDTAATAAIEIVSVASALTVEHPSGGVYAYPRADEAELGSLEWWLRAAASTHDGGPDGAPAGAAPAGSPSKPARESPAPQGLALGTLALAALAFARRR